VNGCEYKSPISTATEFLNPCPDDINAKYSVIMLKNNDTSVGIN
jgi:hypothetical protein